MSDGIRRVSVERGGGWEYFHESSGFTLPLPDSYHSWDHDTRILHIARCRKLRSEVVSLEPDPLFERVTVDGKDVIRPYIPAHLKKGEDKMMFEGIESSDRDDFEAIKLRVKSRLNIPDELHQWLYYGVNHRNHYNGLGLSDSFSYNLVDFSMASRVPQMMDLECVSDVHLNQVLYSLPMGGNRFYDARTCMDSNFLKRERVFIDVDVTLFDLRVIRMVLVVKSYLCSREDVDMLFKMNQNLGRVKMEKYIHQCKKMVLPHYDPKKSYTKLTEEEMPQCLIKDNVFR